MTDEKMNSGNLNSGDWNSGDLNSGNWNSGDWNSGNRNSGNRNSGYKNSGYKNSGDLNSGNWNSGDWNSGDWNSGYKNSGFFNRDTPKIRIFEKETNVLIDDIDFPNFLYFKLIDWIPLSNMTNEEKTENPSYKTTNGYLKKLEYKEAFKNAWNNAPKKDREKLFKLPNFNADIFYEISGINTKETNDKIITVNGKKYKLINSEYEEDS